MGVTSTSTQQPPTQQQQMAQSATVDGHSPIVPSQRSGQFQGTAGNYQLCLMQLRILLAEALAQFQKLGEEVGDLLYEMKRRDIKRGENFEGSFNAQGELKGVAKFYQILNQTCSVFIGYCEKSVPRGKGIKLTSQIRPGHGQQYRVNRQAYEATLLQDWSQAPETPQNGCTIVKSNDSYIYYIGEFRNYQLHEGKSIVKKSEIIKMEHTGTFVNWRIHGKGGLSVPGKYIYQGTFFDGKKQGLGREKDLLRETMYVGAFENDRRSGYGELTYQNRDKAKLKGFWTDGIMKTGDGVYVTAEGKFLELIGDDIVLI